MVDLQDKPDDFVALYRTAISDPTGRGVVPMLECDGDTVLAESMVILDYLEDVSPSQLTAEQRARARLFATLFPGRLSSLGILRTEPGSSDELTAVKKLRGDLRAMDQFLDDTPGEGPFLFGAEFSYAEAAAAPFAQRMAIVLPGVRPAHDPRAWIAEDGLSRLSDWLDAVCDRPSCTDTLPPAAELVTSYSKMVERMKAAQASK